MLRSELHFGSIILFATLKTENTEDGEGWQGEKGPKFPFHLFSFCVPIINAIIYSLCNSLFLLSRLFTISHVLYIYIFVLPAISIGNSNNHSNHLFNS